MNEALAEAEDTMISGQHIPVRDDFSDDDELFEDNQQKHLAASQGYDLTLGENQIMHAAGNSNDNSGSLVTSARAQLNAQNNNNQFKNSLSSRRQGESDGQFSEYNEVLQSPDVGGNLGNGKLN